MTLENNSGIELISYQVISKQDINFCLNKINKFNEKNRAGITQMLHRISCFKNRNDQIIGLTCRLGRSVICLTNKIQDFNHLRSWTNYENVEESVDMVLKDNKPNVQICTIFEDNKFNVLLNSNRC
mgnify:CR=1 FL=1